MMFLFLIYLILSKISFFIFSYAKRLDDIKNNEKWNVNSTAKKMIATRGGFRTVATSKIKHFMTIVNGWKPLTSITKCSILDVAAVLDLLSVSIVNTPKFIKTNFRAKFYQKYPPSRVFSTIISRR